MSATTKVLCEICGEDAEVSPQAFMSVAQLDHELPIGWQIDHEQDPESGDNVTIVRCPNHRKEEA